MSNEEIGRKLSWALAHEDFFPLDVNRASRDDLLRVPGLGVRNVHRILLIREYREVNWEDLGRLHVSLSRVRRYLAAAGDPPATTAGRHRDRHAPVDERQLLLFR